MRPTDCADDTDATHGFLPYTRRTIRRVITTSKLARTLLLVVNHICIRVIRVIRVIRGEMLFLLFLAEFLEIGIGAQRIPDRIEPEKGRCNRR
jgi:hypothetical protein